MLLSSGDSFPHLIKKRRSQLGFVTYLLNYPRTFTFVLSAVCVQCPIWLFSVVPSLLYYYYYYYYYCYYYATLHSSLRSLQWMTVSFIITSFLPVAIRSPSLKNTDSPCRLSKARQRAMQSHRAITNGRRKRLSASPLRHNLERHLLPFLTPQ